MIKDIENKKLIITYTDSKVILPKEIREKIDSNWKEFIKENPNLWNGDVTRVNKYSENNDEIHILCEKTDYAHYLYEERKGLPLEYSCVNISAGCLLETIDECYVIGELDEKMSYPHMLQVSGGNVDKMDMENGIVDIMKTISREVMEEINIDLKNTSQVSNLLLRYIYNSEKGEQPKVQIFAKARLNMTSDEMKEYYNKYFEYLTKNKLELEFGRIHLINKNKAIEILEKMDNPKRDYLIPLIKEDLLNRFKV